MAVSRYVTLRAIKHSGNDFAASTPIALSDEYAAPLLAIGAIQAQAGALPAMPAVPGPVVQESIDSGSGQKRRVAVMAESSAQENVISAGGVVIPMVATTQYPERRGLIGSFGDSFSDYATVNNTTAQDIRRASASNTPVGVSTEKAVGWLQFHSGGALTPVFCGGIGGQTTTQILARALAVESATSTSKSLLNAQMFGAESLVYTGSVNDFTGLTTASTAGQIESAITTALANTQAIFNRARSLGICMVFHAVCPYGTSGAVSANQAVTNAATADYNARARAWIATIPGAAAYWDARIHAQGADGGWLPQYTLDGTHPNHAFYADFGAELSDLQMLKLGLARSRSGLPKGKNLFSNADLSASSSGLATGIAIATSNGTNTPSVIYENGVNKQQIVFVAGNSSGTDSKLDIDIDVLAAGASPYVALSIGDELGLEFDIEIDDGAGAAPDIYNLSVYLRKSAGAAPTIFSSPLSFPAGSTAMRYLSPLKGRIVGGYIVIDEATGASSGKVFSRLTLISQTLGATVRVKVSNVRAVKIPAGY